MKNSPKITNKQNIPRRQKQPTPTSNSLGLSNPINDKISKFGKSIRAKLSHKTDLLHPGNNVGNSSRIMKNNMIRSSQPLQESVMYPLSNSNSNLNSNCDFNSGSNYNIKIRQSQDLDCSSSYNRIANIQDISISNMSLSYVDMKKKLQQQDQKSDNLSCSRSNFSKSKSVRFMDMQQSQSSASLSKISRKNHSILKNSNSSDKLSSGSVTSHVGAYAGITGGLTIKASLKDKGIDCQNKKYQTTLKTLLSQNTKFFDDMFPPGAASLFYSKSLISTRKDIRWMRVQQLFRGQKLVLYNSSNRSTIKIGQFPELNYMATCLNALGTSQRCIERIFQKQTYTKLGIYYLRLNYQGIWKYIIVDDYIPVKQKGKGYQPVFMTVEPTKSHHVQIWPLILQKALAKMYKTYQCLFNQDVQDCMQELTGVICQKIQLKPQNKQPNQLKIKSYLMSKDNILMLSQPTEPKLYPFTDYAIKQVKQQTNTYFSSDLQFKIINSIPSNTPTSTTSTTQSLTFQTLSTQFKYINAYTIDDSHYSVGCIIKQQMGTFSLRTFKVQFTGRCVLSVIQKDKKYFRNNGYQYCWMRVILVQKDLDGYRYINAAYSNRKIVHVDCMLSPGQYYLLLNGDWNKKVYDVTLNYQGPQQIIIKRQPISKYPKIISQTCRDIAQRFGKFVQINKNVCSYQYCDKINGFIIQDFNNQMDRQVYFHRNYWIGNLEDKFVSLGTAQFVKQEVEKSKIDRKPKSRNYEIETFLEADMNITLVLMTVGGRHQQILDQFKFQ